MVSVILSSSYYADVCSSVHVSDRFGFICLFDTIKMGYEVMIGRSD